MAPHVGDTPREDSGENSQATTSNDRTPQDERSRWAGQVGRGRAVKFKRMSVSTTETGSMQPIVGGRGMDRPMICSLSKSLAS